MGAFQRAAGMSPWRWTLVGGFIPSCHLPNRHLTPPPQQSDTSPTPEQSTSFRPTQRSHCKYRALQGMDLSPRFCVRCAFPAVHIGRNYRQRIIPVPRPALWDRSLVRIRAFACLCAISISECTPLELVHIVPFERVYKTIPKGYRCLVVNIENQIP